MTAAQILCELHEIDHRDEARRKEDLMAAVHLQDARNSLRKTMGDRYRPMERRRASGWSAPR